MGLTPASIRNKTFRTVLLRPGYNEDDVDTLLERVEATFSALRGGPITSRLITAEEVLTWGFRSARLTSGYREDEVDEFLEVVATELRDHGLGTVADRPEPGALPEPPTVRGARRVDHTPPPLVPSESVPDYPVMRTEDIQNVTFAMTRLTTGYNEQEVDDFLDRAEETLEALRRGLRDRVGLTSIDVERARFSTTRARPGYDPAEVDAFLDRLATELRRYESPY